MRTGCSLVTSPFWMMVHKYLTALCHTNINSLCFNMCRYLPKHSSTKLGAGPCIHMLCLTGICSPHRAPLYSTVQKQCAYTTLHLVPCFAVTVTLQDLAGNDVLHQLPTSHLKRSRQTSLNQLTMGRKSFDTPT